LFVIVELVLYFISFRKYPLSSLVLSEIQKMGFINEKTINPLFFNTLEHSSIVPLMFSISMNAIFDTTISNSLSFKSFGLAASETKYFIFRFCS
jgi:hypothetical protein